MKLGNVGRELVEQEIGRVKPTMGRPRKNQAKPASKSPPKFVAVRKSSRQIARKQLKDDKVERANGDSTDARTNDCSDDSSRGKEDGSVAIVKKTRGAPRKLGARRRAQHKDRAPADSEMHHERKLDSPEKDTTESDSQDGLERSLVVANKMTAEDVRQMVVGTDDATNGPNSPEDRTDDQVCWSEDVIEETIICEEMEVEGETMESSRYTLADDGSVVLEEVLLVNEPTFKGKNVVEFTVIRNEDGTESMVESMVVASADPAIETAVTNNYEDTSEYHIIEEGVGCLRVNETPTVASAMENTSGVTKTSSQEDAPSSNATFSLKIYNSDDGVENREKAVALRVKPTRKNKNIGRSLVDENSSKSVLPDESNAPKEVSSSPVIVCTEENGPCDPKLAPDSLTPLDESSNSCEPEKSVNNRLSRIDMELRAMIVDTEKKKSGSIEPSDVEDNTSSVSEFPQVCKDFNSAQRTLMNEDEDSVAMSEKSEQSRSEDNFSDNKSFSPPVKLEEENQSMDAKDSIKSTPENSSRPRNNRSNSISARSSQSTQKNSSDLTRNIEEVDGECNVKADSEDVKSMLSSNSGSGSENSNDTSSSVNNCKLPDTSEGKTCTGGSLNEVEKKIGFRSRSGSTDTTGSESGSNSSAVRRSSRIRTIGLMKQRSRGRGLVTKPNLDLSKLVVLQQERERLLNSGITANNQESRDTPDSQSETQSDREGSSNKMTMSTDSQASSNASLGLAGYESDSSKPVKVKSRWRRSSELEMGSSSLGSRLGFANLSSSAGCTGPSSTAGSDNGSACSSTISGSNSNVFTSATNESEIGKDSTLNSSPIPRTVGAKISLPMVLEVKDREMEERLSQFEHLKENAYLTERYTNKETKRMVCDCFLTEEEIERGELGCGEDCLNRLLMIECGSRCVVNDRCTNKRFQNCEYAKCEVFRTEKKGFGLRATSNLEAGEFIMEYVGEVLDAKDFRRRAKDYSKDKNRHYYFMALKSDQIIDATMKGNISRFINHSCDPNAETQKWTVNGELRIGFFNRRFVAAGEEITFDYHFQRYGKEAQRCYCEAPNCRGWIGDTPEEEKEKIEKKEKREKDVRKKKEEKKPADYMEDEDLEEEIDKLCQCGLKNRAHTLNLSRLMVRSRELEHRTRLLRVIQNGDQPCRRLFLDYHGLRLLWSYMMDLAGNTSDEAQQFRLEVLKTLSTLPIPNKTMLMDSKVYSVVQKWSEERYLSPQRESPVDEQTASKTKVKSEEIEANCDSDEKPSSERTKEILSVGDKDTNAENKTCEDTKQENSEQPHVAELATNLLSEWANLKEVFRIPKKERIEQMKEHEREADRGYRADSEKEERRDGWYDRSRTDRYGRGDSDKRIDRRRGRESPDFESYRSKDKRCEERSNLVPLPRLSKFERRQLFAMKVAKEEEERLRRQQQESWQEHEARCVALGIDPHTTATVDPQTGYPLFFNPALGQWQPYPMQDGEIAPQCTPMYGTPGLPAEISPGMTPQSVYGAGFPPTPVPYPGLPHQHHHHHHHHHPQQLQQQAPQQYPDGNLVQMQNGATPVPMPVQPVYVDKAADPQYATSERAAIETIEDSPPQPEMPPMDLPPKWKCAKDARGRPYYYHIKERVSQWLPPPPDHIGVQPDSSSSSETSDESSSSNEDEDDQDEDRGNVPTDEDMDCTAALASLENGPVKHPAANKLNSRGIIGAGPIPVIPEPKKRRDGLVQERIISPRREEDRIDHKKYKDVKEKMRRQKERARLKEHVDKLRKHRRANKSKTHSRYPVKTQDPTSDITAAAERKIKDTFRINMANVMVHFLNPYRKNDCKQGRITNTEDFKHLARKLTHFVLAKELKHCKSVDELQCNENVKHKAKDFVRKYMNKFGEMYHKSDED